MAALILTETLCRPLRMERKLLHQQPWFFIRSSPNCGIDSVAVVTPAALLSGLLLDSPSCVSSLPPQQRRARRESVPSRTSSSSGMWSGLPGAARAGSPRRTPPSDAPRAATASACGRKAHRAKCGLSNKVTAWKHTR